LNTGRGEKPLLSTVSGALGAAHRVFLSEPGWLAHSDRHAAVRFSMSDNFVVRQPTLDSKLMFLSGGSREISLAPLATLPLRYVFASVMERHR
jgi:hypothetical protein